MNDISSLNIKHSKPQEGPRSSGQNPQGTALPEGNQHAASASTPTPTPTPTPVEGREVGAVQTEALAKELNSALAQIDGNYSVSVDNDTGMVVVRITDAEGELVKQVPPQQVLDVSISVEKIIGLLVNDQA